MRGGFFEEGGERKGGSLHQKLYGEVFEGNLIGGKSVKFWFKAGQRLSMRFQEHQMLNMEAQGAPLAVSAKASQM